MAHVERCRIEARLEVLEVVCRPCTTAPSLVHDGIGQGEGGAQLAGPLHVAPGELVDSIGEQLVQAHVGTVLGTERFGERELDVLELGDRLAQRPSERDLPPELHDHLLVARIEAHGAAEGAEQREEDGDDGVVPDRLVVDRHAELAVALEHEGEHARRIEALTKTDRAEVEHGVTDVSELPVDDRRHAIAGEEELVGSAIALDHRRRPIERRDTSADPGAGEREQRIGEVGTATEHRVEIGLGILQEVAEREFLGRAGDPQISGDVEVVDGEAMERRQFLRESREMRRIRSRSLSACTCAEPSTFTMSNDLLSSWNPR